MYRSLVYLALVAGPAAAAPPMVAVVRPVEKDVSDDINLAGRTEASTRVEIRSRVTAMLDKVLFKEGSAVKKGDLLFQFDDRAERAEVEKVRAELARSEARLAAAENDHKRLVKLADAKAVSREELDRSAAGLDEAKAAVLAARAAHEAATLKLGFTRIASPIDGRIGRVMVDAGNLVRAAEDTLATVVVLDPLYVYFDVDERTLPRLVRLMHDRDASEPRVPVQVGLGDETEFAREAVLNFIDPVTDPAARTVRARAVLPNPKGDLVAGLFVRARITLGKPRKVLFVPESAVQHTDDGDFILTVTDKNVLYERKLKVGPAAGGLRAVEDGLKGDEWVVKDPRGHRPGEEVTPRKAGQPGR